MSQPHNINFLQANLNHCAGAQDLLLQTMAEWQVDLAVACEPYYVPPHTHWVGDLDGSVAVLAGSNISYLLMALERGSGSEMGSIRAGWSLLLT